MNEPPTHQQNIRSTYKPQGHSVKVFPIHSQSTFYIFPIKSCKNLMILDFLSSKFCVILAVALSA